eukprot:m.441751 g.441751  ORF g.441751 m.441751 type:complete len:442 (+) comp21470_c0_seq6:122-1447(+)
MRTCALALILQHPTEVAFSYRFRKDFPTTILRPQLSSVTRGYISLGRLFCHLVGSMSSGQRCARNSHVETSKQEHEHPNVVTSQSQMQVPQTQIGGQRAVAPSNMYVPPAAATVPVVMAAYNGFNYATTYPYSCPQGVNPVQMQSMVSVAPQNIQYYTPGWPYQNVPYGVMMHPSQQRYDAQTSTASNIVPTAPQFATVQVCPTSMATPAGVGGNPHANEGVCVANVKNQRAVPTGAGIPQGYNKIGSVVQTPTGAYVLAQSYTTTPQAQRVANGHVQLRSSTDGTVIPAGAKHPSWDTRSIPSTTPKAKRKSSSASSSSSSSTNSDFKCNHCGKTFASGSSLKRHARVHTGDRPYSCQTCNRAFSNNSHLKRHEILHTGIRPYKCQLCARTFTRREHLRTHALLHLEKSIMKSVPSDSAVGQGHAPGDAAPAVKHESASN